MNDLNYRKYEKFVKLKTSKTKFGKIERNKKKCEKYETERMMQKEHVILINNQL